MNLSTMRGVRGTLLLALGTIMTGGPGAALAQAVVYPPGAVVQPLDTGPGAELRRNLTSLADNPQSLPALIGAGQAALGMGDAEAAYNFYTRADAVAPRDYRVKAGMASALVRMERAGEALPLFAQAVQLGAPEADIAGDRGLAYDSLGDPRHAQQDYTLALRRRDDPEIRRNLALSLAISGQRDAALQAIDRQLRSSDRAAWRTQAFILALTGDTAGAGRIAQNVMPVGGAQAMAPFFARLPQLSPSQKALAVHFGHFPSDGRAAAYAQRDTSADPGAMALAQNTVAPPVARPRYEPLPPLNAEPRRRPGSTETRSARTEPASRRRNPDREVGRPMYPRTMLRDPPEAPVRTAQPAPVQVASVEPRAAPVPTVVPAPPALASPVVTPPIFQAPPALTPAANPQPNLPAGPEPQLEESVPATAIQPAAQPAPQPAQTASAGFTLIPQGAQPNFGGASVAAPAPAPPVTAPASGGFDQVAALVLSLPAEAAPPVPVRPAPAAAPVRVAERAPPPIRFDRRPTPTPASGRTGDSRTAATRADEQGSRGSRNSRTRQPANPSRHWVQIAGGADTRSLPREFNRLKTMAPTLLGNRAAYTTPLNATNRLLVGPFDSSGAAQSFVNQLVARHIAAFAWTSPAGQEIERLQIR